MWFLIKNNPVKLYRVFKRPNTSLELQEKIIERLKELRATEKLWSLLGNGFDSHIIHYLINDFKDYVSKLLDLFNRIKEFGGKTKIIRRLVELDSEKELYELLDVGFNNLIVPYLIEKNDNNPKKLYELYGKDNDSDSQIIDLLIELKAEKELLITLDISQSKKAVDAIADISKDNPDMLLHLFRKVKDEEVRTKIINRLIELDSEKELYKLLDVGFNNFIVPYLTNKNGNIPEKLYELYGKDKNSDDRIVDYLIELRAEKELITVFDKDKMSKIIPALIDIYKQEPDKLLSLFGKVKQLDQTIVQRLIDIKARYQLKTLIGKGYNREIIDAFVNDNYNDSSKLYDLIGFEQFTDNKIIGRMTDLKAESELRNVAKIHPEKVFFSNINNRNLSLKNFFKEYSFWIDFAMSDYKTGIYFFDNIYEKYKIFLLLYNFGISSFIKLPKIKADLSMIEYSSQSLSEAKKLNIAEVTDLYEQIFKRGEEEKNEKFLTLCYLIDKSAYHKRINDIKNNDRLVYNVEAERKIIASNYTDKIHKAEKKSEIEKLLQMKEHDISRIYDRNIWDVLNKIPEFDNKHYYFKEEKTDFDLVYEPNFTGKKLDLLSYSHLRIVEDVYANKIKLEEALKKELYNLNNPDEIMKAKDTYKKEIDQLISVKDFSFTAWNLKISEINDDHFIHLLGNILIETNNVEIKKIILYRSAKSNNLNWLKHLHRLDLNSELHFFLFEAMKNKYTSSNLRYYIKGLTIDFKEIHTYNQTKSVNTVSFSSDGKYLASGSEDGSVKINEMLDYGSFFILDHLFYLYSCATVEDIKNLRECLKYTDKLPLSMRKPVSKIIESIIERAGKESNTIEISENGNPESTDIEIK